MNFPGSLFQKSFTEYIFLNISLFSEVNLCEFAQNRENFPLKNLSE